MTTTPIAAWPPIRYRGKPGYSARHFAALAGAPEDPLRVAERIAMRRIGEEVSAEAHKRVAAGESWSTAGEWVTHEIGRRNEARWLELCESFEAVIAELQSAPVTPVMKRLITQAKKAAKEIER